MNKKIIVTTSWDDGHVLDMRLAEFLRKYNLKGTFYVSPKNREFKKMKLLNDNQIKNLSENFEIGAHTMTHPRLSAITLSDAKKEIEESKQYLEQLLNKPVESFCYPGGDFNTEHEKMVQIAGFRLARNVKRFATKIGTDDFSLSTTIHAYRHWSDAMHILNHAGPSRFLNQLLNWDELAISIFDKTLQEGGAFHLWGHSWEIGANNDWNRLERVFKYISNRSDVNYIANKDLV